MTTNKLLQMLVKMQAGSPVATPAAKALVPLNMHVIFIEPIFWERKNVDIILRFKTAKLQP